MRYEDYADLQKALKERENLEKSIQRFHNAETVDEKTRKMMASIPTPAELQAENIRENTRTADSFDAFLKRYEENEAKHDKSEKTNLRIAIVSLTVSSLTLIATVLFGILALLN